MLTMKPMLALGAALGALIGAVHAQTAAQPQPTTYAITNARLLVAGDGAAPRAMADATLIITDGRIAAVGANLRPPAGAEVIDAKGAVVTPGLFAALSGLGLEELSLDDEANDRGTGDSGMSASLRAADAVNADSSVFAVSRAGGITRAVSSLDVGGGLFSGCAVLVSTSGGPNPIGKSCAAQMATLGYAGAARSGDSRAAAIAKVRAALDDARDVAAAPLSYRQRPVEERLPEADARALGPVLRREIPLLITANSASDIRRVIALAAEYNIRAVIVGGAEAHRVGRELAAAQIGVILNPIRNLPDQFEMLGASLQAAGELERAGVTVAFYDDDIGYTHNLRLLPQLAGNAVANGMSYEGAIAAITINPARLHGMDTQLGSLTVGKFADVVIWSGDPLELSSRPTMVFIEGRPRSLENRQTELAARYKDLSRGALPHAYRGE